MSIVRCPTCGEIVDAGPDPYCWGCGKTLSGADASSEPRLPPVMRQARQDAGWGRIVLGVLGAMVLAGMFGIGGGGSPAVFIVLIVSVAFIKSVASQRAADSETAAAVTGVLNVILKIFAVLFVIGLVLAVGAFVFIYIVCLSQGGGGGGGGGWPGPGGGR